MSADFVMYAHSYHIRRLVPPKVCFTNPSPECEVSHENYHFQLNQKEKNLLIQVAPIFCVSNPCFLSPKTENWLGFWKN